MRGKNTVITWTRKAREELVNYYSKSEKSQMAELTAILLLNGNCVRKDENTGLYIYEDQSQKEKNIFTEKRKTYNIKGNPDLSRDPSEIYRDTKSQRAFLRGAFLAIGSLSDPEKSYQLDLASDSEWQAKALQKLMGQFGIRSRISRRRDKYVVYLKEGPAIVDMLNVIGAHNTLMEFENIRIVKEMRESVNRQVNCETANINKTVTAAVKQLQDIELLDETVGIDHLDENLQQICRIRRDNPDAALSELGNLMVPPLGKSGVNHRLRKISRMAEDIRNQNGNV